VKATLGIDVSKWSVSVNWAKAQQAGVRFAFLKATAGVDYIDPTFPAFRDGAATAGMLWSGYHWFTPFLDPGQQAAWLARALAGSANRPTLPPVIDLEDKRAIPARYADKVLTFLERTWELTGLQPIIYTSPSYWETYLARTALWADVYPLWIANYQVGAPKIPLPWAPMRWTFWQFSDKGNGASYGVSERAVDLNVFNGSEDELAEFAAQH
jgi:lysozyme